MPSVKQIVIVGPTASGKTSLSLDIAKIYNGAIIAADSRTVYIGMDIGTAKPSKADQLDVAHYCLDLVEPSEKFSVADYVKEAKLALTHISDMQKLPIIVGGSGLYINSLIYNYGFVKANPLIRDKYSKYNVDELQEEILKLGLDMPNNYKNRRHLQSTLERRGAKGTNREINPDTIIIGLAPSKEDLTKNIANRAQDMIKIGVIKEVKNLFDTYGEKTDAFNGGIYKIAPKLLSGQINLEQLKVELISSDLKLAKKQMTWFKRDKNIKWFSNKQDVLHWLKSDTSIKIK